MSTEGKGIKQLAQGRKDLFLLAPKDINIDPDWNVRIDTQELKDHIATLSRSIAEIGVQQPITVRLVDKLPYVTDGFCRMAAVKQALENGADIKTVPVRVEERYSNEADHTLSMLTRNSVKNLSSIEQAFVFKRLMGLGWDKKEIQAKTGFSVTHVNNLLDLMAAPPEIVTMLKKNQVSTRLALASIREEGPEKAAKMLKKSIETAKAAGKTKATARTQNKGKAPRIQWGTHGPELMRRIKELCYFMENEPPLPARIADGLASANDYIADNELAPEEKGE